MRHFDSGDDLLALKRAAEYTGLQRRTIGHLAESSRLRYFVITSSIRSKRWYRRSDLDAILRDPTVSSIPAKAQRAARPPLKEAIVAYLRDRPSAATIDEIHQGVTGLLGEDVPRLSVASAVYVHSGRTFARVKRGLYRLRTNGGRRKPVARSRAHMKGAEGHEPLPRP